MKGWVPVSLGGFILVMLSAAGISSAPQPARAALTPAQSSASSDSSSLDYEFFKTRVEPIFLKKRPGHARCYVCHEEANHALHLEKLSPGASTWDDEQSRKNFETASQLVNPDDPSKSKLLLHPLAPEAGGDAFHSGGRQFNSKDDADWKTLSEWARGQKATASAKP